MDPDRLTEDELAERSGTSRECTSEIPAMQSGDPLRSSKGTL
jgi:hypothetical protein